MEEEDEWQRKLKHQIKETNSQGNTKPSDYIFEGKIKEIRW